MCLIIFAYRTEPSCPLIVAANRDEFYSRPGDHAHFWTGAGESDVLAGRDRQAGGTWLGITRGGRFAAVTNIRDPARQESKSRSRGELTRNFLLGHETPKQFGSSLRESFTEYAGYNLLLGDRRSLVYVNNHAGRIESLDPGIYGLSNGELDDDWAKVSKGKRRLRESLQSAETITTDTLLALMSDRQQATATELPGTGSDSKLECQLSSPFINNVERGYGTLCSTGLLIGSRGELRFCEQNFDEYGEATSRHFFQLAAMPAVPCD